MITILEKIISYNKKIRDFEVDPSNKNIITTGENLTFLKNGVKIKEIQCFFCVYFNREHI